MKNGQEMHALIPARCGSLLQLSASAHLRGQVKNCMHLYLSAAVRSLLQVRSSGDRWRTQPEMHALIPARCGSFLQPSASACLRGQVKSGPQEIADYTELLVPWCAFRGDQAERNPVCIAGLYNKEMGCPGLSFLEDRPWSWAWWQQQSAAALTHSHSQQGRSVRYA